MVSSTETSIDQHRSTETIIEWNMNGISIKMSHVFGHFGKCWLGNFEHQQIGDYITIYPQYLGLSENVGYIPNEIAI